MDKIVRKLTKKVLSRFFLSFCAKNKKTIALNQQLTPSSKFNKGYRLINLMEQATGTLNKEQISFLRAFLQSPLRKDTGFLSYLNTIPDTTDTSEAFQALADAFNTTRGLKEGRLYVDGCFDLMHSGHFNALRKAKLLNRELVCGVCSNEEIIKFKGPPIMNDEERETLAGGCKWVDEVRGKVPYIPDLKLLDDYNCQYVGHGDDIIVGDDGKSIYSPFEDVGRFKTFKRTEGISTTDILGRILDLKLDGEEAEAENEGQEEEEDEAVQFMNVASQLEMFMQLDPAKETDKVVYVFGCFDLLHPGHIKFFEEARKQGTYLIVGIHNDKLARKKKGKGFPIININERVLNVLAMKNVDDVLIGAPLVPDEILLKRLNISVVIEGERGKEYAEGTDPYRVAKKLGIYQKLDIGKVMTSRDLIERVKSNEVVLRKVFEKKKAKQQAFYESIKQK